VVDRGMYILWRKDSMASMTIRATRGSPIAVGHRPTVHALSIKFHRMYEGYLVPGKKLLVAVAGCASVRQVFLGNWRGCITRDPDLMHRSMTGKAIRRVRVACRSRSSMGTLLEYLHFIGVALGTHRRRDLSCADDFMRIAVARLASRMTEGGMNAVGHMGGFLVVAGCALDLHDLGGVRVVLDGRVAVIARQNTMDAGSMLGRINRNAFAASRRYAWLAVTGKAVCVLLEGMRSSCLRCHWDGRERET
jgi:hypothetical protein